MLAVRVSPGCTQGDRIITAINAISERQLMTILQPFNKDGLNLLINLDTGEVYASQRGLARICNVADTTIMRWVGAAKLEVNSVQIQTPSGVQGAACHDEATIKKAIIKYNPDLLEKIIDCGLRIYLHGLAGYKYESSLSKPKVSPYIQRIEHFNLTEENIPTGYWCIFGEMTNLLGKISLQYPVGVYDLVDGSVGKHWSNYRKEKDWATERRQYLHIFPDKRGEQLAWCYHLQELMYFRVWYEEVYRIDYLPQYLLKKYGELVLQK
jgi:hypothetical protein